MFQFNYSSKFLLYFYIFRLVLASHSFSNPQIHVTMSVNETSLSSVPMLIISICENPLEFLFLQKTFESPDSFLSQRGALPFSKHPSGPLSLLIIFCSKLYCLWYCSSTTYYATEHRNVLPGADNHPHSDRRDPIDLCCTVQINSPLN